MAEGGIQVHGVMVTPTVTADVEHSRSPKVADKPTYGPLRQRHIISDLADCAFGMDRNVEEDGTVAGYQIPVIMNRRARDH